MLFRTYDEAMAYVARFEHYALAVNDLGVFVLVW